MTKVIIFKEPFREYIFDASTEEQLVKAYVSVVNRRIRTTHFRYFTEAPEFNPTPKEQEYLDMTEEDVNAFPPFASEAIRAIKNKVEYRKDLIEKKKRKFLQWQEALNRFKSLTYEEQLKAEITLDDAKATPKLLAKWILESRIAYAGENYEIRELDTV